jgi:hypothetical protein
VRLAGLVHVAAVAPSRLQRKLVPSGDVNAGDATVLLVGDAGAPDTFVSGGVRSTVQEMASTLPALP